MADTERDRIDPILDHIRENEPGRALGYAAMHLRLRRIAHHLETETRRRLAPRGMEFAELSVLANLVRHGGTRSVGELQDLTRVTSGAITQRLAKLEEAGHVRRTLDGRDRRQVNVSITAAGRDRVDALVAAVTEIEDELFASLDADLVERLGNDLRTVVLATEGPAPQP